MQKMTDIYYKVDSKIVKQDFWNLSIEEKKQIIDQELKKYAILKINEIGVGLVTDTDFKDFSLIETLQQLSIIIPKEDHFDTLRHFVHYILNVAGTLQGYGILWICENNENLKEYPIIDFDENGKWTSLTTIDNEDIDYVKIFTFVHDTFHNQFMSDKVNCQKRIIKCLEDNFC